MAEKLNFPLNENVKARILAAVEEEFSELIEIAQGMLRIKSVNPNQAEGKAPDMKDGETKVNRYLEPFMAKAGMKTDLFAAKDERHNLVGTLPGIGGGRSLLFNGHIDVVGVGNINDWTKDPWGAEIADGRIYGRGASDMKSGIACAVAAAIAIKKAGVCLKGDVIIESVCGEEAMDTAAGTGACIDRNYTADAGIVVEPSGSLDILPASCGVLIGELLIKGKATHSCMRHEIVRAGGVGNDFAVSALDKAIFIYEGISRLEQEWGITKTHPVFTRPGHFTICPCSLVTGPVPYAIPSEATIRYSSWFPPYETTEEIKAELCDYLEKLCSTDSWLKDHLPTFNWIMAWPPYDVPIDTPICQALEQTFEAVLGKSAKYNGCAAVCDASFLNKAGIPTVTMGPGNSLCAHAADEYVEIDEMRNAAKIFALTMAAWCGVDE